MPIQSISFLKKPLSLNKLLKLRGFFALPRFYSLVSLQLQSFQALMATTILLYNWRNGRNERFPPDFTTWSLVKNPSDGLKNVNTNQNV